MKLLSIITCALLGCATVPQPSVVPYSQPSRTLAAIVPNQATPRHGRVVICQMHEMYSIFDTAYACDWRQSGVQWYVKGCDEVDYWSDKAPRLLKETE